MLLADTVPKHLSGEATIGLISSQGTLRMPLSAKMSLTLSARRSYLNMLYGQWLKADGQTIHYSFYDVNATLLYKANETNSLLLDVYHGNDRVSFEEDRYLSNMKDTWGNTSVALHWLADGQHGVNSKQSVFFDVSSGNQKQFDLYTFLHEAESDIDLQVTAYDNDDNVLYERDFEVPMEQDHITWLTGAFFNGSGSSSTTIGGVTVNTDWAGETHITF